MKRAHVAAAVTAAAALAAGLLASCSASANGTPAGNASSTAPVIDEKAPVTITIGEKPPADQQELLKAFQAKVDEFQKLYPNITLKAEETTWSPATYQAMVAGGTLPTTLRVPLTEIQGLAARGQVRDITDIAKADPVAAKVNPSLYAVSTRDNRIYGIPVASYTSALLYNRAVYTAAGLDPDKPPTTWDEVRANAKTIKDKTGKVGWAMPTTNNFGGWALSALSNAMGGRLENEDGTKATIDSDPVKQALKFIHTVRWEDDAFGSNFLMTADDVQKGIASGAIGQAIHAGDRYNSLVVNWKMPPGDVGIAPLPQDSDGIGTLAGGSISIVRAGAKPEEAAAAVKWVSFYYLNKYVNKDAAIADATSRQAQKLPVGFPTIPIFDKQTDAQYMSWISSYVDVPREHFTKYLASADTLPFVAEPRTQAQQIYKVLDSTVQAVLTEQNANVDKLASDANRQAQTLIDSAH